MTESASAVAKGAAAPSPEAVLRDDVVAQLRAGDRHRAARAARALIAAVPGRRTARYLRECAERDGAALVQVNVALLSSFSIEFLTDALIAQGVAVGMHVRIRQAPFSTFRQQMLDPNSALYEGECDVAILAVEGSAWVSEAYDGYVELADSGAEALMQRFRAELLSLVGAFRERSRASLIVHNLASPEAPTLGIYDPKAPCGQRALVARLNDALSAVARTATDVHVVDYGGLVNRFGARNWYDDRMRLYAGAPIANAMQPQLAREYVKFLAARTGLSHKCLVVDLDNTLWGGVVGEDGVNGIALGPTYPGNAFVEFQRYVRDLGRRGIVVAVASKNNAADVDEVFEKHAFMVLRKSDFAAMEVNWGAKSESLVRLAQRLSLGLEHMVFVDDNPAECSEVERALPMVRVVHLPAQPEGFVRTLQDAALFDTLALSDEDRRRGELYRQRAEAEAARASVASVEDYYRDLAMTIRIVPVDGASVKRTAQLTQKTNQLNVTTLRYSEADVAGRMVDPAWTVLTVSVTDRFGDNGIVGVMMAKAGADELAIDTLLLSCRVIGRGVETAMMAHLCDEARRRGLTRVVGRIIPTAKNEPARDMFARNGFALVSTDEQGTTHWRIDVAGGGVPWPDWFARVA